MILIHLSDQIPALGRAGMEMPVALVAHPDKAQDQAVFWPFSDYSPERQTILWALEKSLKIHLLHFQILKSSRIA